MSSEFARITQIEALLRRPSSAVTLGIGDDCAVLAPSALPSVWTMDAAVEGVHFARSFMELEDIAYRAFMAAASDIAAMGGRATAALSALALPHTLSDEELRRLVTGLARAADECACPIIGGNLARAGELSLTTTVLGECPSRVLSRAGAKLGDGIFVTGTLGGAALGLRLLQRGMPSERTFEPIIQRFLAPRARLDIALELAEFAHAAIDVSDGLVQDLTHLCRASGVGAQVEAVALPVLADYAEAASSIWLDPTALALEGGEDYEILFTAPHASVPARLAQRIGTVVDASQGVVVFDRKGQPRATGNGFDHFADS
ncbi:MAG: thiamine-phosphate kinase [Myxococcaceae bacterium]|nr:thiamine-phosphate kinase [Myxococcaceae bacterium]